MTIGIIGAMESEVSLLKSKLTNPQIKQAAGLEFFIGSLGGKNVVVVQSGIGKVNAALCAQALISLFGVNYVVNTGVAGGLCPSLNIGDIVVSADLVQHDMDVAHFNYPRGTVPGLNIGFFCADTNLVQTAVKAGEMIKTAITTGRIATGDCFVSDIEKKQDITQTFNAACVEMEGAAIAQTCFLNNVPFVVIRAISDKADESATVSFDKFVVQAAQNSSNLVEKMLYLLES